MVIQPKRNQSFIHQLEQGGTSTPSFVLVMVANKTNLFTKHLISSHGPYGEFGTTTYAYTYKKWPLPEINILPGKHTILCICLISSGNVGK